MKIFNFILAFIAWLQIVASPLIIGVVIGFFVFKEFPTKIGWYVGLAIAALGLTVGIIWASRIWKKQGTVEFMSRVSATPEQDEPKDKMMKPL